MDNKFHFRLILAFSWPTIDGGHRITGFKIYRNDPYQNMHENDVILFNLSQKEYDKIYVDCANCHLLFHI